MSKKVSLDHKTVESVKRMLWEGTDQEVISATLGISQASVSRIKSGKFHSDVPWPGGATGPMPSGLPTYDDWSADAKRYSEFPEEIQNRMLEAVNKRRGDMEMDPIPDMAPEYERFLDARAGDADFERSSLEDARGAESLRLAQIMVEFDAIIVEGANIRRQEELESILSSTKRSSTLLLHPPEPGVMKYDKMSWEEVLTADPKNRVVLAALATKDPALQEAICIVFHTLRGCPKNWTLPFAVTQVNTIAERLRKAGYGGGS